MRSPLSSKSDPCTEGAVVDATGISVRVGAHYRGDLSVCLGLPASRGVGMGGQKSAEGIVGLSAGPKAQIRTMGWVQMARYLVRKSLFKELLIAG